MIEQLEKRLKRSEGRTNCASHLPIPVVWLKKGFWTFNSFIFLISGLIRFSFMEVSIHLHYYLVVKKSGIR